jgi:transcriptional regulator with XRE-family HTH domain
MGARMMTARKSIGMTQVQLAKVLHVSQQTLAGYEAGARRIPVTMLPLLSTTLAISIDDLLGVKGPPLKRGPAPKLLHQVERIQRLPKSKQKFVMQMIDTALLSSSQAEAAE